MTRVAPKISVALCLVSFSADDGSHAPPKSVPSKVVTRPPTPPLRKLAMNATSGALIVFGSIFLAGTTEIVGVLGGLLTFAAAQAFTR